MTLSIFRLPVPARIDISKARETITHTVDDCRKKGYQAFNQFREGVGKFAQTHSINGLRQQGCRFVKQFSEEVERYTRQFAAQHPEATRQLKTFRDYMIKAASVTHNGIQSAARGAIRIHNRITQSYTAARHTLETRYPKVAIAIKGVSQFTLNPITYAMKGAGLGLAAWFGSHLLVPYTVINPFLASFVLGGAAIGAGFGLARAALNSARYTLKVEGTEQHPYLAKAVALYDRILKPVKTVDQFMERLHPALSIPYKAIKEFSAAAINIPTLWVSGVFGILAVGELGKGFDHYTALSLFQTTIYGGIALGTVIPLLNTSRFACKRIREYMEPKPRVPGLRFMDDAELGMANAI